MLCDTGFGNRGALHYNSWSAPEEHELERLEGITEQAHIYFETKNEARDKALARSRELIRHSARAIRAVHRQEFGKAAELLSTAREAAQRMVSDLADHPDLYHAGYTQAALKEFAEANITFALITDKPLPTPEELEVLPAAYLNGLAEAMGELRRHILDVIRRGEIGRCEEMLQVMEDVYSVLVTIDYPDALTSGLRRTTDMVRGVLKRSRGDVTVAARQEALQHALHDFEKRVMPPGGAPSSPEVEAGSSDA
jgi:translin